MLSIITIWIFFPINNLKNHETKYFIFEKGHIIGMDFWLFKIGMS